MLKRFLFVLFTLFIAVGGMLVAAKEPLGPNAISYDDPANLLLSIGMVVFLFIPPLVLAFFKNAVVRIISVVYQSFIAFAFLSTIPVGFTVPNGLLIVFFAITGTVVSITSIVITMNAGLDKKAR